MASLPTWATQDLIKKMMHYPSLADFASMSEFLAEHGTSASPAELEQFRLALEEELVSHTKAMATRYYQIMELSNDYGECGEQRDRKSTRLNSSH